MNRILFFAAGMIAGAGGMLLSGLVAFPGAEAAPATKLQELREVPREPGVSERQKFLEQRCTPGFRHSPVARNRYSCARIKSIRCPRGTSPANVRLYRSGNDAAGGARLTYECRMSETVRPSCGRGFVPANLKLYRSGGGGSGSRIVYECVRYRRGN